MMRRFGLRHYEGNGSSTCCSVARGFGWGDGGGQSAVRRSRAHRYRTGTPWRDLPERFGDGQQSTGGSSLVGEKRCVGSGCSTSR